MGNLARDADIQRRHAALLQGYERVLRAAARLPLFSRRYGFGFLVRFFVEGHVRSQLRHLAAAYCVIEHDFDRNRREWLSEARDRVERMSEALKNLGGSFAALTPLAAVAAVLPFVPSENVDERWGALILVLVGVFGYIALYGLHKRGMRRVLDDDARGTEHRSIQELEVALFDLLPLRKRWEIPQVAVTLIAATCLAVPGLIFCLRGDHPSSWDVRGGALLLVIGLGLLPYHAASEWWMKPHVQRR